jgi:hypothetical protein
MGDLRLFREEERETSPQHLAMRGGVPNCDLASLLQLFRSEARLMDRLE